MALSGGLEWRGLKKLRVQQPTEEILSYFEKSALRLQELVLSGYMREKTKMRVRLGRKLRVLDIWDLKGV